MRFLNIAFYRFTPLKDPAVTADHLQQALLPFGIKGTLIFAPEGVNGFLAGEESEIRAVIALLEQQPGFANLQVKESYSSTLPFEKLAFKIRPEIVTFRHEEKNLPEAPYLSPQELESWYKNGEEFIVLDTRNEYEFKLGAFQNAQSLQLKQFVEFPEAAQSLPPEWRHKKILTYCTGGIRCEKAAPYLRSLGFDAYQLDGGILNYFEKVGDSHWQGECFVFDERVALNANLEVTGATLCPHCQGPVPALQSCPHCGG